MTDDIYSIYKMYTLTPSLMHATVAESNARMTSDPDEVAVGGVVLPSMIGRGFGGIQPKFSCRAIDSGEAAEALAWVRGEKPKDASRPAILDRVELAADRANGDLMETLKKYTDFGFAVLDYRPSSGTAILAACVKRADASPAPAR